MKRKSHKLRVRHCEHRLTFFYPNGLPKVEYIFTTYNDDTITVQVSDYWPSGERRGVDKAISIEEFEQVIKNFQDRQ